MDTISQFETCVLSRARSSEQKEIMNQLMARFNENEIKIVDVKRHGDDLIITYRSYGK